MENLEALMEGGLKRRNRLGWGFLYEEEEKQVISIGKLYNVPDAIELE
jgi:hypothetical protein